MLNEEQRAQIEKLQIRNQELMAALYQAIATLECYQIDIGNSEWTGVDLVKKGFCQGSMYLRAVPVIKIRAHLPLTEQEARVLKGD